MLIDEKYVGSLRGGVERKDEVALEALRALNKLSEILDVKCLE